MREYKAIEKGVVPFVAVMPSMGDLLVWHYIIHDLPRDTPYAGGVYHGKLVFPKEYPFKPPAIYMITPTGRFRCNERICFSMSDFHPETWNPSWTAETILIALTSFMLDASNPRTTGTLETSLETKRTFAKNSFHYNRDDPEFVVMFPSFADDTKYHPSLGFALHGHPQAPKADVSSMVFHYLGCFQRDYVVLCVTIAFGLVSMCMILHSAG